MYIILYLFDSFAAIQWRDWLTNETNLICVRNITTLINRYHISIVKNGSTALFIDSVWHNCWISRVYEHVCSPWTSFRQNGGRLESLYPFAISKVRKYPLTMVSENINTLDDFRLELRAPGLSVPLRNGTHLSAGFQRDPVKAGCCTNSTARNWQVLQGNYCLEFRRYPRPMSFATPLYGINDICALSFIWKHLFSFTLRCIPK